MPKYIVPGIPPGAQLSAFMPSFTRMAASGAVMYKHSACGQPGTQGIPAPTTSTQISPDDGDKAQMGTARSSDAPDMWYPNLYYDRTLDGGGTMGFVTPVRIYSDNLLPVPARDPRGRQAVLANRLLQRGQLDITQPRAMPTWG